MELSTAEIEHIEKVDRMIEEDNKKPTPQSIWLDKYKNEISTKHMPFKLSGSEFPEHAIWGRIDDYDIRFTPTKGKTPTREPYFLEINTYPNDPIEVLKKIDHITMFDRNLKPSIYQKVQYEQ